LVRLSIAKDERVGIPLRSLRKLTPEEDREWKLRSLPQGWEVPELEHHFWPGRKFAFDYAWVERKFAIEIEGGAWIRGRHNRGKGFLMDMEKYNMAVQLGWKILRFPPGRDHKLQEVDWCQVATILGGSKP
jgi:hypothetical protein